MVKGGQGAGSGLPGAVDLRTIPVSTIKRVEVLKDGASAIYGSDGIAGVVNIITKNDYEGAELKVDYGITGEDDGKRQSVDLTVGSASDKGNVVFSAGWSMQEEVMMGDRKRSEFELRAYPDGSTQKGGSSAPPWSNVDGYPGSAPTDSNPLGDANVSRGPGFDDWRAYNGGTDSYNYNPVNYHQTPNDIWYLSASAGYELGNLGILEDVRVFSEASYIRADSDVLYAPEPLAPLVFFGSAAPYSPDNYYNQMYGPKDPDGNSYTLNDWRRRMVETGGRASASTRHTARWVIGLEGSFSNGWGWDMYYMRGEHQDSTYQQGYFNLNRVAEAVGPTHFDANGVLQCGTADAPVGGGCVPLNIFGEPGTDTAVTPEMLQYISGNYNTTNTGENSTESWAFSVNGELMELPAGFAGFAFGVESRSEQGSYTPDSLLLDGSTTAGSSLATSGEYDVDEAFLELVVPLVADTEFADSIELSAAVRYSDYSTFGSNTSGKLGVMWRVNDGLTFRATKSDAFRAPDVAELYGGASTGFPSASDPCANIPSPNSNCTGTGVPAAGFDDGAIEQIPTRTGGNTALTPEEADILTVGMVYSPDWADGLSFTLDYWDIELTNYITTIGTQVIMDACFASGEFCDKIQRIQSGPNQGTIIQVNDANTNVGGVDTSGIDFNAVYSFETADWGDFKINFDTSYLIEYVKHNANGPVPHQGWLIDNQDGNFPRIKANVSLDWNYGDFSQHLAVKYIHHVNETESGWWTDPFVREVDSNITVDWQGTYYLDEYNTRITLGVLNLLDEEPPWAYSAFNANTDGRTYDVIGRQFYLTTTFNF
jgi:outer membrane receptor protein involved in Fe transport